MMNDEPDGRGRAHFEREKSFASIAIIDLSVIHDTNFANLRHSGEGRNPARQIIPRSGQSHILGVVPLRGVMSTIWIPAFAGMTKWEVSYDVTNYGNLNNRAETGCAADARWYDEHGAKIGHKQVVKGGGQLNG